MPVDEKFRVKVGLAEMLKGGVIMDVVTAEQAKVAEQAGAAAVMAKCRIGHIAEARVLEALKVDFIDESEVLTPADEENHVWKRDFTAPFVCGCRNLGEALRRIGEGAAMIRTKGEAGTGDIVHAVKHLREVHRDIRNLTLMSKDERMREAKRLAAPFELVEEVAESGRMPVPNFAAGGVATPADAALCMMLGAEAIFVGSGIFKSDDPALRARAIVKATTHWQDAHALVEAEESLGTGMKGIEAASLPEEARMQGGGW